MAVPVFGMLYGQSETERISKELSFEGKDKQNTLVISNINGSISVEGYNGNTVAVEVEKVINGKTAERLSKGMREIGLGIVDRVDTIILYTSGVCPPFGKVRSGHNRNGVSWGYTWDNCNNETNEYDFRLNFIVRVPPNTNVLVSTINEGEISVSKVSAPIRANNVNGGIRLSELSESAQAHTVNGNVEITYIENPETECRFYTLNGDINAYFRKGLSSTISFKSFNGEFFTNVENLVALPVEVQKQKTENGKKYKVDGNRYSTGNGGALLDFETFNGNVYLREQ